MSTSTAMLLSMSEIASLANVRRPVVTMWRARSAAADLPFPSPVTSVGSRSLFDADEIVRWLKETGRGNNADADRDAAGHADAPDGAAFTSVSALLALRAATGTSLVGLTVDDLLDMADAADPDDVAFFSEVAAVANPQALTPYVDALADAAYGDAAAYERMLAAERRRPDTTATSLLTTDGARLVASVVHAMRSSLTSDGSDAGQVHLVDATGAAVDVIVELAREEHLGTENISVLLGPDAANRDGANGVGAVDLRDTRCRLTAHGIRWADPADEQESRAFGERRLHLLIADSPAAQGTATSLLSAVDELAMRLDSSQFAVVVAPSSALSDGGLDREADQLRSGVLRSGQVRAIVRLPHGLRSGMPRQSLTLWVMGAAHPDVDLADRWTMVADLSTARRNSQFDADLISDLAASLGSHSAVRAHAFRFARLVFTRTLLARRGSLMPPTPRTERSEGRSSGADDSVKVEAILDGLGWPTEAVPVAPVDPAAQPQRPRLATFGQRIASRQVRYLSGSRLSPELIEKAPAVPGRIPIVGVDELLGNEPLGSRSIDRARFVAEQPSGRFTEPGDVIFCTSPKPTAIVDPEGLSAVLYPARILRIRPAGDDELLPDLLAADINDRPSSDSTWRSWPSRGVDPHQRAPLTRTLNLLRLEREATLRRLALLDDLESTVVAGVARGSLTLTSPAPLETPAPSKGTH